MNGVRTHTSVVIGIDYIGSLYGEHLTCNMHYIELYIVCMMFISYISSLIFLILNLHFLTEILLKVALNTIKQTNKTNNCLSPSHTKTITTYDAVNLDPGLGQAQICAGTKPINGNPAISF